MAMREQDRVVLALTVWRENRGHGMQGMQSVANVVLNRAAKRGTSAYAECVRPWQFSSLTGKGDAELSLWPEDADPQWVDAQQIAALASAGGLADITDGALLYYAPGSIVTSKKYAWLDGTHIPFPQSWDATQVTPLCSIGGHVFFR